MKKFLLLFLSVWITFACSEEKEIPSIEPPIVNPDQNEDPKPAKADSIYYQLNVDGFELVAATEDSTCLFLQTDTTFAFRCLFDSCGSNRMLAYCDSTGLVERIVVDELIVNILHHADKKKMDIFYKDAEGKMAWIKDVDSPYKVLSSRAEGDVPYSAISIVNDLSYAVYTIINTYDVVKHKPWENFIDKYSRKEFYNMRGTVALKLITQILGEEYKVSVSNHISTIVTVMSDYSKWVREELYGTAIPHLRKYAVRETVDGLILTAYVTDVDSLSNEFAVGVIVAENGNELNCFNYLDNQSSDYDSQKINYSYSFMNPELVKKGITLVTGKDYKFIPYLAPASTSKYATGIKSLLDCYKYGSSQTHLLLETKAEIKSMEDDQATIKLSVENADKRIKMGIIYSEHSKMLKHEYKKVEHEPTFKEGVLSNNFEKEVKIERLESGYTYYMPYVIYDDDVLNRPLDYSISSETIYETDQIFYGKKDSIVSNPITGDAELNGNTLKFKGRFYTELEEDIEEYGICYSMDDKEITVENSSVLKANTHQKGNFEVSTNITDKDDTCYYRAYIKIKVKTQDKETHLLYYGDTKKYTKDSLREALIKLYNSTNGDNWTRNDNWCSDEPVWTWYGVYHMANGGYDISLRNNNLTSSINQTFPKNINILDIGGNNLTSFNVSGSTSLTAIHCSDNQLTSLDASGCISLKSLKCDNNKLSSLNVSGSTSLTMIKCENNELTSLDISECTSLNLLWCGHNQLSSLDVSNLVHLESFICRNNQLTTLDVSKNTSLNLLWCDHNQLSSLDVSNLVHLESLCCSDNQLTTLDVSKLIKLKVLDFGDQIASIDFSKCTDLEHLSCSSNEITSLDLSKFINFRSLWLSDTDKITSIDLSKCTNLEDVHIFNSQLTSLDLSNLPKLTLLYCSWNEQLKSLNVTGCKALKEIDCSDNAIESFSFDGCISLDELDCTDNNITHIIPDWFSQLSSFNYDKLFIYGVKQSKGWYYQWEMDAYNRKH